MCVSPFIVNDSQRVRADDFPVIAVAELLALRVGHRARTMQHLLDVAAGSSRRVEKHNASGVAATVPPRMRDAARKERVATGSAHADIVTDTTTIPVLGSHFVVRIDWVVEVMRLETREASLGGHRTSDPFMKAERA